MGSTWKSWDCSVEWASISANNGSVAITIHVTLEYPTNTLKWRGKLDFREHTVQLRFQLEFLIVCDQYITADMTKAYSQAPCRAPGL